ncbi:hypothetical protein LXL04_025307 [Taraxacum kok-saghyz]
MTNVRIIPPPEEWVDTMNKVTDFLSRKSQITDIRPSDIRYVKLQTQEMFDKLVDLYAEVFLTQWHHFRRSMLYFSLYFPPKTAVPPHIYAARCYISIWFIDLYYCNRLAVEKLSPVAFKERYQGELSLISHEYDTYLTLLNASIRPTLIQNASKNTRYIPIIADCIDVKNPNPFRIKNFTPKRFFFYAFTELMKIRNLWNFSLISNDARGRPCWLFDWHSGKNACAWFPSKDNYDLGDVTLAYILGTACTPKLGVRDVDEWQYFADGIVPHDPNPSNYDRVAKRQFYGSYEVRVMEIDREFSLAWHRFLLKSGQVMLQKKTQHRPKSGGEMIPPLVSREMSKPHQLLAYTIRFYIVVYVLMSTIQTPLALKRKKKLWHFAPLSSDPNGRPCWLFDWHSMDNACSWFPDKDNFDMEDVALAYILGTACTPNLGACDVDEWQCFHDGIVPHDPNPKSYDRVNERHLYGSYEVRAMEVNRELSLASTYVKFDPTNASYLAEKGTILTKRRRKNDPTTAITLGEESQEPMPEWEWEWELVNERTPRFRLIDCVYYYRVILKRDNNERINSLRFFSLA